MIIGLCGPAGAGKTTVAKYLVEEHDFERIPFAKVLKDMSVAFGLTREQVYGDQKEVPTKWGWTPRQFMQWLGTEFGRNKLGENIWVDIWKHHAKPFKRIVVDDVRFPNEVQAIHDLGGKVILIDRGIGPTSGAHQSEQWHTLNWNMGLSNLGTIQDLCRGIEGLLWTAAA